MRGKALALLGAVLFVASAAVGSAATAERVWTDDVPSGRPYVKPPLPERRLTPEAFEAARNTPPPPLEPFSIDPLRTEILSEIIALKMQAAGDDLRQELLDQLGTAYAGDLAGPFWISSGGFNPKAERVAAEMARADQFAIDPSRLDIPTLSAQGTSELAQGEVRMSLAVMSYAQEAFGARFKPNDISLWLDNDPVVPAAGELLPSIAAAADPAKELLKLHPSHPDFEQLRVAYLVATGKRAPARPQAPPPIPDGPVLNIGANDPVVAVVRERLDVPAEDVDDTYFDRELGNAIRNYLRRNGKRSRREINDDLRQLLNAPPPPAKTPDLRKIEANLLRWRWLPRELGSTYVWNNIPEFTTRLFSNGHVIHQERIIVGQPDQQTPIFSDTMEKIVFKPQWGVPNSIKITDLLPKLRGGDYDVLDRRGMKIVKDGRTIDPERIRWASTDIRYLSIVQGPSAWNPLGELKFIFPNRHSVYMHDTTSKGLFGSRERTFSHGCIRVRNPRKLAEKIFTDVQGWDPKRIPELLGRRGEENNEVMFDKPIPVHNVYFTLVPDGSGSFRQLSDIYGHDRRISEALSGKSLRAIANNDPARIHKRRVEEIEKSTRYQNSSYQRRSRSRYADDDSEFQAQRSGLGAAPARAYRQPRRSAYKPAWPPIFSFFD